MAWHKTILGMPWLTLVTSSGYGRVNGLIGVSSRKGRSGWYSNMGKGSSVEYGVPARSWAVGAGSRRAMYSVLTVLARLLCRCVCVCVVYWLAQLQYLQFHDRVGTAFSSIPAAKSSQYVLHF